MKTRIVAGLVASFALLTAVPADAGSKKHGSKHAAKATTRPAGLVTETAPARPAPVAAAKAVAAKSAAEPAAKAREAKLETTAKASRFIASGVPLAEVRDGRIKAVGTPKQACGSKSRWAKKGSAWTVLDAWGQTVAGGAKIADSRLYEGSGCHEVRFDAGLEAGQAARLFVASGSGYTPGTSAKWNAEARAMKRFEHLYAAQESAWVEGKLEKPSDGAHLQTLYFSLPRQEDSVEGAPTQRRPIHWAVAGGRVLVVGYVGAGGAWKVAHVLAPHGKDHSYEPLAVLDMNGDGMPEIVVHEETGGVFVDRVLAFDPGTLHWENSVASPGGATQ